MISAGKIVSNVTKLRKFKKKSLEKGAKRLTK
jgi:hypothetical protein